MTELHPRPHEQKDFKQLEVHRTLGPEVGAGARVLLTASQTGESEVSILDKPLQGYLADLQSGSVN